MKRPTLYAEGTTVAAEKTRVEIETLLTRYGASSFGYLVDDGRAAVAFKAKGRRVRLLLPVPSEEDPKLAARHGRSIYRNGRYVKIVPPDKIQAEVRRRWRALLLAIKSKLENVASGIETFEEAFLAQILLPGGQTVGEAVAPRIEESYLTDAPLALLPAPEDR